MSRDTSDSFGNSSHDELFMSLTLLAAQRSKDPCTQVGACIADSEDNLLGMGYNGMPRGINDDEIPWSKGSPSSLQNKYLYVCHAELNAIANTRRNVRGCKIYVTLFPCNECAKLIIQHGIKEVIYLSDKNAHKESTIAAKSMFRMSGVTFRRLISNKKIVILLDDNKVIRQGIPLKDMSNLDYITKSVQSFLIR